MDVRVIAASIMLFTLSSFMCGNSSNIWELVTFRFIQGLGGGALLVTAQTIITETYPPEKRGMAQALYFFLINFFVCQRVSFPLNNYAHTTFKSHVSSVESSRGFKFMFLYVATYMYTSNLLKSQFLFFSYILTISEGEPPLNCFLFSSFFPSFFFAAYLFLIFQLCTRKLFI